MGYQLHRLLAEERSVRCVSGSQEM